MGKGGCRGTEAPRRIGVLQALKDIAGWGKEAKSQSGGSWGISSSAAEPSVTRKAKSDGSLAKKTTTIPKGSPIPMSEVKKHNTVTDAWIVIKSKVYDVTEFGHAHPGGEVIYTWAGKDATEVFSVFHATSSWSLLKPLEIGELTKSDAELSPIVADFRKMRAEMIAEGLFKSNKWYYAFKCTMQMSILALSLATLVYSQSWPAIWFSAAVMGLFWQQCGWLAHDFLHHQVFSNREMNNYFGYFWGNLMQGFSVGWWKSKHNTHHAATNELDHDHMAVDPDIDTLPIIAWSKDMLDTVDSKAHRALVSFQHYIFFPVLLFARLSWLQQSYAFARHSTAVKPEKRALEVGGIVGHYFWLLAFSFAVLPFFKACAFVVLSECLCGAMLSIVFVQSHNGMEVFHNVETNYITAQMMTTRDINGGIFNDWFTGGLNRQIEHHLFPSLPRHNLGKIQGRVKALCDKHEIPYEICSMVEGTSRVLGCLKRVADIAATEAAVDHATAKTE